MNGEKETELVSGSAMNGSKQKSTDQDVQGLVRQYKENEQRITEISEERDTLRKNSSDAKYELKHHVYYDKIRVLEEERDEKIDHIEEIFNEKEQKAHEQKKELYKPVAKVERILSFLKLKPKSAGWIDFKENEIKNYQDKQLINLGAIYKDDFLKIVLFIYENRKPKNKYSLVAIGKSKFGEKLIFGHSYGIDLNIYGEGFGIAIPLRDAPSVEELKAYIEKHKEDLLKAQFEQYQNIKKEYMGVLETYKIDDFKELLKYRCKNCNFFLTEREERGYSIIDKKCPRCKRTMVGGA